MSDLPAGAVPLSYHAVTPEISAWAVELLHDASVVMGAVTEPRVFGDRTLVARVEEHTWFGADPTKAAHPHRGVSLYEVSS